MQCIPLTEASRRGRCSTRPARRPTGWTIVAIHDSRESWERFRDGVLMPRMAQGIEGGFTAPPQETTFEVYNQVTA